MNKKHLGEGPPNLTHDVLMKYKALWGHPFTSKTVLPEIDKNTIIQICNKSIRLLKQQALYIDLLY